jgi:hypothetical protein
VIATQEGRRLAGLLSNVSRGGVVRPVRIMLTGFLSCSPRTAAICWNDVTSLPTTIEQGEPEDVD